MEDVRRRLAAQHVYAKLFWDGYRKYSTRFEGMGRTPLDGEGYYNQYWGHFQTSYHRTPCNSMCYQRFHAAGCSHHENFVDKMRVLNLIDVCGRSLSELAAPSSDESRIEEAIDAFVTLFENLGINSAETLKGHFARFVAPTSPAHTYRRLSPTSSTYVGTVFVPFDPPADSPTSGRNPPPPHCCLAHAAALLRRRTAAPLHRCTDQLCARVLTLLYAAARLRPPDPRQRLVSEPVRERPAGAQPMLSRGGRSGPPGKGDCRGHPCHGDE